MKYVKLFDTTLEYTQYINSSSKVLPNTSCCKGDLTAPYYNPLLEERIIAKFKTTYPNANLGIMSSNANVLPQFTEIEIDGVVQETVDKTYKIPSAGTHTIKYTLADNTSLVAYSFASTGIIYIFIPSTMTNIGSYTLNADQSLEKIVVSKYNPTYDSRDNCNALIETATNTLIQACKTTVIPSSVETIKSYSFNFNATDHDFVLPDGLKTIQAFSFGNGACPVSINIPKSLTSLGISAFNGQSRTTSITVDPSNPVYDSRNNCNAIINTAANKLVMGCQNTVIPNTVTVLGGNSFQSVTTLSAITVPSNVITLENNVFAGCSNLTSITFEATTPPTLGASVFLNHSANLKIYVPSASVNAYKTETNWSNWADCIEGF